MQQGIFLFAYLQIVRQILISTMSLLIIVIDLINFATNLSYNSICEPLSDVRQNYSRVQHMSTSNR